MKTVLAWAAKWGALIALLAILAGVAEHYRQKAAGLAETVAGLTAESASAARIISNQQRTFAIFNSLSQEAEHEKRQIQQDADQRGQTISQALSGQKCADEFMPDVAAVPLLDYADRLRADSLRATASQPDSTH